ncbi:MAG: ATP synthase F1 subunit gamma [Verrucomicrobiae bacterium]|nr:ATP synthase F1 subunit gamma [Verrucomicrobiae bacterium]
MPSIRDIRQHIRGIRNIRQVTRAMNMTAAARLRRAQAKLENSRAYAQRLGSLLQLTLSATAKARHPMLDQRPLRRAALLVISSDRGLCGPFNSAILREAGRFVEQQRTDVGLIVVGRKARDFFQRMGIALDAYFPQPSREVTSRELRAISETILQHYCNGHSDQVHIVYAHFVSALKNEPRVLQLLPVHPSGIVAETARAGFAPQFEPPAEQLLDALLRQYLENLVYTALVESFASEQASRMIAMKAATDSATEMIESLTHQYNRARQTAITTQILEVVSGAEALKHAEKPE